MSVLELTRHLPGRHDQSSHGRRGPRKAARLAGGGGVDRIVELVADAASIATTEPSVALSSPVDRSLARIARRQGFDVKPRVVSAAELDRAISSGATEIWRGVKHGKSASAAEISERFRSGDYEPGLGLYGNGFYFSENRDVAEFYTGAQPTFDRDYNITGFFGGPEGGLVRAALDPGARVLDYDDAERRAEEVRRGLSVIDQGEAFTLFADPGRYAAAAGYDAIRISGRTDGVSHQNPPDQILVLNRGAVLVQRAEDQ